MQRFLLSTVLLFYRVTLNTELANIEPLFLSNTELSFCQPLVTTYF